MTDYWIEFNQTDTSKNLVTGRLGLNDQATLRTVSTTIVYAYDVIEKNIDRPFAYENSLTFRAVDRLAQRMPA